MSERLSYAVYRQQKNGNGSAATFETNMTSKGKYGTFLELAPQLSEKSFDWKKKITVSLGLSDLGAILSLITRRVKEIKDLFHDSPSGGTKIISLKPNDRGGLYLNVSHKKEGDDPVRYGVSLSEADLAILVPLLQRAVILQSLVFLDK